MNVPHSDTMKIVQVIPYFVPAWSFGGPLAVAYNISRQLVKRGHQVVVLTTDVLDYNHKIKQKREIIDGIKVIRYRETGNIYTRRHNVFLSPGMLFEAVLSISEMGHFLNRTLWHDQAALTRSLRFWL